MAKAPKFSSLKAAHDWLEAHGFEKTEMQHVWQNGTRIAAVSMQLGGVMPQFLITTKLIPALTGTTGAGHPVRRRPAGRQPRCRAEAPGQGSDA